MIYTIIYLQCIYKKTYKTANSKGERQHYVVVFVKLRMGIGGKM